ncbi:uncharacterized protein LOC125466061 [Stegostoma tigrinum]|uniref:uncharacterized protein LOC125466061 n=1 Tax=Stegostoma tigrinum TaxID=3053191 RepID=UPI00202AC949|nr:uncharacterized protein LOC125466061 [Stegostoma tigrinum]
MTEFVCAPQLEKEELRGFMAKFSPKEPSDVHRKQGTAVPVSIQSTFNDRQSPKAMNKGGLPLRMDSNINAFKQEGHKPLSGLKLGAQPGMRSQDALKFLSEVTKSAQTEKEESSNCTAGSIPLLMSSRAQWGPPDTSWQCQASTLGPSSKTEALRQNLIFKLQPPGSGDWKDCQVPGVRCPSSQRRENAHKELAIPKQRTLPSVTGPMPEKPKRPPRVSLQKYQRVTETQPVTSSVLPLAVKSQAHQLFIPIWPEDIEKVHLQIVKNNRQPMCQQEEDEYDDVEPVGLVRKKLKGLNIYPPIPPFIPGSTMEEETYDDITVLPDEFPDPPPEFSTIYDDVGVQAGTATTNSQRTADSIAQSVRTQNCMVELKYIPKNPHIQQF